MIQFFQKCQFSWLQQKPSVLRIFNILLYKVRPNKYGFCCIGKPPLIERKLTFLDFVGPKYSEKSRGARKIDSFGKKVNTPRVHIKVPQLKHKRLKICILSAVSPAFFDESTVHWL